MADETFFTTALAIVREGADLSLRQVALLHLVAVNPGRSVKDHADHMAVAKPAVTRAVDRLTALGYTKRPVAAADRRQVAITLTAAGEKLVARMRDGMPVVKGKRAA